MMGDAYYRFGDVHSFLQSVLNFVRDPQRASAARWSYADVERDSTNEDAVWVEVLELDEAIEGNDQTKPFFDDYTRFVFERRDQLAASRPWSQENRIAVLDQIEEQGLLLLERAPSSEVLMVKPNPYVVQRQIDAVHQLQNAPLPSHAPLLRLLQDPDERLWPHVSPTAADTGWVFLTNDEAAGADDQRRFVQIGLATPDLGFLEGPPGSGKTTVICELITQLVRQRKRVLLCASTHVAVDNVLERLEQGPANDEGVVAVRIGDPKNCSETVRHLRLEDRVAEEKRRLLGHLEQIEEPTFAQHELLEMARNNDARGVTELVLDTANLVCGTTIGILQYPGIKSARDQLTESDLFDVLIVDEASKTTFQEFLVPAVLARRWILVGDYRQLSPMDNDGAQAVLSRTIDSAPLSAQIGLDFLRLGRRERAAQSGERRRGIAVVDAVGGDWESAYSRRADGLGLPVQTVGTVTDPTRIGGVVLSTSGRALKEAGLSSLTGWQVRSPWNGPETEVVTAWAREVGWRLATLYQLRLSDPRERTRLEGEIERLLPDDTDPVRGEVDAAISRINGIALPSVLESLQVGIGERGHRQSSLSKGLPEACIGQRHVKLRYQYRMHPDISAFPREHFYSGEALIDAPGLQSERAWDCGRYSQRVSWVDVRASDADVSTQEADQVLKELTALAEWSARSSRRWSVGVVCFYRVQESHLRDKLRAICSQPGNRRAFRHPTGELDITLGTVDAFQGHEADIVFLSLGKNWITSFTSSPNRVNVALTRARYQLVVVGNHPSVSDRSAGPLPELARRVPVDVTWKPGR